MIIPRQNSCDTLPLSRGVGNLPDQRLDIYSVCVALLVHPEFTQAFLCGQKSSRVQGTELRGNVLNFD
jgi:hypothetical protein